MIHREPEKLAAIEQRINQVKENGYGEVIIKIIDGQITHVKTSEDDKWPIVSPEELNVRLTRIVGVASM